jgi:hypothetical protein
LITDDYEKFNPDHDFGLLIAWLARMVVFLVLRMISSEWYSLICFVGVLVMTFALQSPEHHLKPIQRYVLAFGRKLHHICYHKVFANQRDNLTSIFFQMLLHTSLQRLHAWYSSST